MSVKVDTHEVLNWIKDIETKTATRGRAIAEFGTKGEMLLRREAAKTVDTGKLFKGIDSDFKASKTKMTSTVTAKAKHSKIALETGRGPGGVNTQAIVAWAQRKGMTRGIGFVIAKNIARSGTKKYRAGGKPKLYTNAIKKLGMTSGTFTGSPAHKMITKIAETYE